MLLACPGVQEMLTFLGFAHELNNFILFKPKKSSLKLIADAERLLTLGRPSSSCDSHITLMNDHLHPGDASLFMSMQPHGALQTLPIVTGTQHPLVVQLASRLLSINGKSMLDKSFADAMGCLERACDPVRF